MLGWARQEPNAALKRSAQACVTVFFRKPSGSKPTPSRVNATTFHKVSSLPSCLNSCLVSSLPVRSPASLQAGSTRALLPPLMSDLGLDGFWAIGIKTQEAPGGLAERWRWNCVNVPSCNNRRMRSVNRSLSRLLRMLVSTRKATTSEFDIPIIPCSKTG